MLSLTFIAFFACFCTNSVIADVIRGKCRRTAQFIETDRDRALSLPAAGALETVTNISLFQCSMRCTANYQCRSLNVNDTATPECELLSFNKTTAGAIMEDRPGWVHYEPTVLEVVPKCRPDTCGPKYTCVESCTNAAGYECKENKECFWRSVLFGEDRAKTYEDGTYVCEFSQKAQWFEFRGGKDNTMSTTCPKGYGTKYLCKGASGAWLNGAHPSTNEGIVERQVCLSGKGGCCQSFNTAKVRNCGNFYVYYLTPLYGCFRYCSNSTRSLQ